MSDRNYGNFIYLLTKNENHVQLVLNLHRYSKKYVCPKCTRSFASGQMLEYHYKSKVCGKKRFVGESQVTFPYVAEKIVSENAVFRNLNICKDTKYAHCLINGQSDSSISLSMEIDLKGTDQMVLKKKFENLTECASYIIEFPTKCALWVLAEHMALHYNSIRKIETALNDYENADKEGIDMSKLKQLQMVKNETVKYLSKYDVYLSIGQEDPKMVSNFMYELLSRISEN